MAGLDPTSSEKMTRLAILWGQAKPSVVAYVRSTIRNHHDAEDAIQTIVSRIAERFDDYDPARPFVAWALGFARLTILEYRKRSFRGPLLLSDDALDALSGAVANQSQAIDQRHEALEHCIDRLSDRHREVLVQRYRQEQTREQIAERLQVKQNTISVMLRRIRQALAECVRQRLEGASS